MSAAGAEPPGRQLLLLRHAKAVAETGAGGDHARALSDGGQRDALALGALMRQLELRPELALVSSALRTRRTWELLAPIAGDPPRTVFTDRLYLASPEALLAALREVPDATRSVMLVGHNPGLSELALRLVGHVAETPADLARGLPTCTLATFEVAGDWRSACPRIAGAPRILRP